MSELIANAKASIVLFNNQPGTLLDKFLALAQKHLDQFSNDVSFAIYGNEKINDMLVVPEILTYVSMIVLATTIVIIGCYASLDKPSNAKEPNPEHPLFDQSDNDNMISLEDLEDQTITEGSVFLMPILAGMMLVGLYYGLEKLDHSTLNYYLNKYIVVVSGKANQFVIGFMAKNIIRVVCYKMGVSSMKIYQKYRFSLARDSHLHSAGIEANYLLPSSTERERIIREEKLLESRQPIEKEDQVFNYFYSFIDILSYIFGFAFTYLFDTLDGYNNWLMSNIFSANLAIFGMAMSRISSFKGAFLILTLFFFYDIYFVFGSEVMVKVATSLQAPVKLMIPTNSPTPDGLALKTSMLGLGDLVLPAMLISLCLRYDLHTFHESHPSTEFYRNRSFPRPYFKASLVGYAFGLASTVTVLHIFKHGQPALLYLSPSLIISVSAVALYRGEFKKIWSYSETDKNDNKEIDLSLTKVMDFLRFRGTKEDKDQNINDLEFTSDDEEEDEDYTLDQVDEKSMREDELEEFEEIAEYIQVD